ncbi:nitrilase-related carbon-nitrogen hydrolase [Myroides pelagicus]|uniref:Omega-amidase YafV n=2 Tax=Myroides pelagicus TaxID=270914 RepID=A0A7K1GLS0_9FLAO|nr:nitrilase-related carbon-nitrogen hydrolase [Myroides pelagicus]MTH29690.1 nitrilase family protein [Myroides pelagicus]
MNIALIQAPMQWEDIAVNFSFFEREILSLKVGTDLVILPEMFLSGFTMQPKQVAISMDHDYIVCLKRIAHDRDLAIVGSLVIEEEGRFYNRLLFIEPTGKVHKYNKCHLFSLAGEEKVYTKGDQRIIIEYKGWRICPLICYDLRFPVFARNKGEVYDLLIYVASWPDQRIYAWDSLLKARAIENMSYTIGVNRSGTDENDNEYSGHTQVIDYLGKSNVEPLLGQMISYVTLDLVKQQKARLRFNFLGDADDFKLI